MKGHWLKNFAQKLAKIFGYQVVHLDRIGVEVEADLNRLTADSPINLVFDVGANFGQTTVRFARAFPAAMIYSFEPVPETFLALNRNVRSLSNAHTFQFAMGEGRGGAEINIAPSASSNSLKPIPNSTETIAIAIETLDDFCRDYGLSRIDLLKIDVEGFELEVLRGANGLFAGDAIRFIYAECTFLVSPMTPHTSFFDLYDFLSARGFCVISTYQEAFYLKIGSALVNVLFASRKHLPEKVSGDIHNIV